MRESAIGVLHRRLRLYWIYGLWCARGRHFPPPHLLKQRTVRRYKRRFGPEILIETGTLYGDMIEAVGKLFREVHSIELSSDLHARAQRRFARRSNVTIIHGDSADVLPRLLESIDEPCLFWLDGHFSKGVTARGKLETPISAELEAVLNHGVPDHVILIDDARCFTGEHDYPTISELRAIVEMRCSDRVFEIEDDIIRIHRQRSL